MSDQDLLGANLRWISVPSGGSKTLILLTLQKPEKAEIKIIRKINDLIKSFDSFTLRTLDPHFL